VISEIPILLDELKFLSQTTGATQSGSFDNLKPGLPFEGDLALFVFNYYLFFKMTKFTLSKTG